MALLNDDDAMISRVDQLAVELRRRGIRIATAESCTGGLIAALCTSIAGSSDWFERGFVTYSNEAKVDALGVPPALIDRHGAVSAEVAQAMAVGALRHSAADVAISVTGIAGPGGATPGKPVGLVWMALAYRRADGGVGVQLESRIWPGDRTAVRSATVQWGLERMLAFAING